MPARSWSSWALIAAHDGTRYPIGTLRQMGPGYFPLALGVLLIILGIMIAGTAIGGAASEDEDVIELRPQWWGWFCIIAGPALFILLGRYGGMLPATFACVFVAALGDRQIDAEKRGHPGRRRGDLRRAAVPLSAKLPMPMLSWGAWS